MQINDKPLYLSRRAEIAIDRLDKNDREKLLNNIKKVLELGLKSPNAAKLKGIENTYLIRSGRDLRIIFEVDCESVYVLDVVRHDKLEQLSRLLRNQSLFGVNFV